MKNVARSHAVSGAAMAFFGLTYMGPQRPVGAALSGALDATHFTVEELKEFFDKHDKDESGKIESHELPGLLKDLYRGGDVPEDEVAYFRERFDVDGDGAISWEELQAAFSELQGARGAVARPQAVPAPLSDALSFLRAHAARLRATAIKEDNPATGATTASSTTLRMQRSLHRRDDVGPTKVYRRPLTESQEVGWGGMKIETERKPRKSSEETRFAAALVRHGVYF